MTNAAPLARPVPIAVLAFAALVGCGGESGDTDEDDAGGGGSMMPVGGRGGGGMGVGAGGGRPPDSDGSITFVVDGVPWNLTTNATIAHHTQLELLRGWAGETESDDVNFFNFHMPAAVGDYSCSAARLVWKSETGQFRASDQDGDCALSLETFGEVGDLVTGTFSGTLVRFGSEDITVAVQEGRFAIIRSFDK